MEGQIVHQQKPGTDELEEWEKGLVNYNWTPFAHCEENVELGGNRGLEGRHPL